MRVPLFLLLVVVCVCQCAWAKMEPFIVGGQYAKSIEDFPHVAFLLLINGNGDHFGCGSSILNQYILITAAHCTEGVRKIIVTVGNINRNSGTPYAVELYQGHPNWNELTCAHDISVCKLLKPLIFGKNVKRVMVMKRPPHTMKAEVAGWGAVEEQDYTDTDLLKHTDQLLWTNEKCRRVLGRGVPSGTICGGQVKATSKFCSKGDSGSGLIVNNKVLVGIVSFKYVQLSRGLVVYTDAAHYYSWIKRVAEKLAERCSG